MHHGHKHKEILTIAGIVCARWFETDCFVRRRRCEEGHTTARTVKLWLRAENSSHAGDTPAPPTWPRRIGALNRCGWRARPGSKMSASENFVLNDILLWSYGRQPGIRYSRLRSNGSESPKRPLRETACKSRKAIFTPRACISFLDYSPARPPERSRSASNLSSGGLWSW